MNREDYLILKLIKQLLEDGVPGNELPPEVMQRILGKHPGVKLARPDELGEIKIIREQANAQIEMLKMTIQYLTEQLENQDNLNFLNTQSAAGAAQTDAQPLNSLQNSLLQKESDLFTLIPNAFVISESEALRKSFFWSGHRQQFIYLAILSFHPEQHSSPTNTLMAHEALNQVLLNQEPQDAPSMIGHFQDNFQGLWQKENPESAPPQLRIGACVIDRKQHLLDYNSYGFDLYHVTDQVEALTSNSSSDQGQQVRMKIRRGSNFYLASSDFQEKHQLQDHIGNSLPDLLMRVRNENFQSQKQNLLRVLQKPQEIFIGFGF